MAEDRGTPVSNADVALYVGDRGVFLRLVVELDEAIPDRRVNVMNLVQQPATIYYRVLSTGAINYVESSGWRRTSANFGISRGHPLRPSGDRQKTWVLRYGVQESIQAVIDMLAPSSTGTSSDIRRATPTVFESLISRRS